MQVTDKKYPHTTTIITGRAIMPRMFTITRRRCQKCGDSVHIEGFWCPAKKYQCKSCHKYGHFTSLCYQMKQASFKPRKQKAHMLQAGDVYACDKSICSHAEVFHPMMSHYVCKDRYSAHKLNVRRFPHHLT